MLSKVVTAFLILFVFLDSSAGILTVCETCPLKSVTGALKLANPHDTILVNGGVYAEGNIRVEKSVTLIGSSDPVLDGRNGNTEILTIAADSVYVEGFTVQNVGKSFLNDLAGIRIQKKDHITLVNNKLVNTMFGIYLEKARYVTIKDNTIRGKAADEVSSGNGIHAWYSHFIHITGNVVENHRDGIYFEFVESSTIEGNESRDNLRYGLHFMFSNNDDYTDNEFERNGAGVAVMFSRNINMYRNTFRSNWGSSSYGLLLKEIYDARIEGNRFVENTAGIKIDGSTRITYRANLFRDNGWAIRFFGGCYDNTITGNNFIGNNFDLVIESAKNNNTIDGNYWSDYTGYDLDRDGIGDVPYRPVKLFSYIISIAPESMVLLRSFFVDIINYSEKVRPVFPPEN